MDTMLDERRGVTGIGYEGLTVQQLAAELTGLGVSVLVDVRLNAISRKRGFSKKSLASELLGSGIEYRHMPALGNPPDNRAGFAADPLGDDSGARARFRGLLSSEDAQEALANLTELAMHQYVAVLCFEQSELHCHRREVLQAVRSRLDEAIAV